ncbi:MAG: VOC family protein [Actinomycetota bacterium]|nr:VOC family protein [Actinomycetota bacterium]
MNDPDPITRRGLHHIGYWTDDLDVAMAQAAKLLGVGPFRVIEHVKLGDFRFRGEPAVLDHSAAFAQWGPVILELNVAHEVRPPGLRAALGVAPGAVSHTSWWTNDLAAEGAHLEAAGCALLTTSVGGAVADWFTGGSLFAHPIEIHQPTAPVLGMWGSLREGSIYS